jgi:signal transduction histidine kinase
LRSPFTSLLGFAQLLDANARTYSRDDIQHKARRLLVSAERLYALLENLLTWSRLQHGAMKYQPQTLLLREIVIQNLDLFQAKSEEKGVALYNHIAPATKVYADELMLDTILRNLLSNALKFTASGGSITISSEQDGVLLYVAVADTGVGMNAATMDTLFGEDTQHTSPGTAGERGTGLGLLLCKELVHKNGGTIRIDSQEGQGTTFTCSFPISSPH